LDSGEAVGCVATWLVATLQLHSLHSEANEVERIGLWQSDGWLPMISLGAQHVESWSLPERNLWPQGESANAD